MRFLIFFALAVLLSYLLTYFMAETYLRKM